MHFKQWSLIWTEAINQKILSLLLPIVYILRQNHHYRQNLTTNRFQLPRKLKIDVANPDDEGSSAKEFHQSNQGFDKLRMVVKETRNFLSSFTRSIKKVTDHLYKNHERWQNQPNFKEFCLKQVKHKIGVINRLLAGFAQGVERLCTFIISRPLPPNELSVRGNHPLRPF